MSLNLPAVHAQDAGRVQSPVLVVEPEQLFRLSAFGQRVAQEVAQAEEALAAENRTIEAELEAEEKALTEERPTLAPEVFRDKANAFDEKVRSIRREQLTKARELQRRGDDIPQAFLAAAAPILEQMMREAGAAVVLERRSVFLSVNVIDITDEAVARIDAQIGDGAALEPQDNAPAAQDE